MNIARGFVVACLLAGSAYAECTLIPMPRKVSYRNGSYFTAEGAEAVGVKRMADSSIKAEG